MGKNDMELMKISQKGIDFIKKWEGCRLTAYKPVQTEKYYTIGIGHYGSDVKQGQTITQSQAEELFRKDILPIQTLLNVMGINFKQCQFDALCSWIFNLGIANFNSSTMKKKILSNANDAEITDELVKWVNSNGIPMIGLKRRRAAEANLWHDRDIYFIESNKIVKHY